MIFAKDNSAGGTVIGLNRFGAVTAGVRVKNGFGSGVVLPCNQGAGAIHRSADGKLVVMVIHVLGETITCQKKR